MQVAPFVGVEERDSAKRAITFKVPSTPENFNNKRGSAKYNVVRVISVNSRQYVLSCFKDDKPCLAMSGRTLCYHCLAAMIVRIEENKGEMVIFQDEKEAKESGTKFVHVFAERSSAIVGIKVQKVEEVVQKELNWETIEKIKPKKKSKFKKPAAECCECHKSLKTFREETNQICDECAFLPQVP